MPYKEKSKGVWTGRWIGQVRVGQKVSIHRCKTKKEAVAWEEERKLTWNEPEQDACKTSTVSLGEWATAYLDFAKARFVEKTYDEKRLAFRELFEGVATYDMEAMAFRGNEALQYLEASREKRGGNAANKRRKNLRSAWEWGIKFLNMPRENPFDAVPRFAEVREERRVPTLDEFWKVYRVADKFDQIMLTFALHTGARRDEIFRTKWADVDFNARRVRLHWRKNQAGEWKEAWLPMSDDLEKALRSQRQITGFMPRVFMHQTSDGQWVPYQYRQHWMKRLCKRAGVEPFGFHGIRHLFASILAAKNVPLVEIQKMLRHGSIQTTARYIHSLQQGESREAMAALPRVEEAMG